MRVYEAYIYQRNGLAGSVSNAYGLRMLTDQRSTNHGNKMKRSPGKARLLTEWVLVSLAFVALIIWWVRKSSEGKLQVELWGIYVGLPIGLLAALLLVVQLHRSAQKSKFIFKHRPLLFFIGFLGAALLCGIFGGLTTGILSHHFPQINWMNVFLTSLVSALFIFFPTVMVGLYCLERRHGKKFYLD